MTTTSEPAVPTRSLKVGQAYIVGRVFEVSKSENATYTTIQTPAPDAYSHPGNHRVTSRRLIAKPGEEIKIVVQLAGFRRSYTNKDGEKIYTVDNQLQLIED